MNFVHSKSQECTKSELDLFSAPPTQVSLEKGHWIDHQPVSSVSDGGPITFLSPGTEDYVDLSKTILVVRAKVTKADGANLDADEKVAVVNNFYIVCSNKSTFFFSQQQKNLNSLQLYFTKILQGKWTQSILRWLLTTRTLTKVSEQDISLVEKVEPLKWLVLYSVTCLEANVSY